ncbi:MAG: 30S ribosomal protein S17e [Methanobacteriota archaeon]|nr:MAG: 30S ribosomal protein S17e [Euryarchaeota archaeon]
MGRVRQRIIKNTAAELVKTYGDRFTTDFKHNRDVLKELLNLEGTLMRNRIAGAVTRIKRQESLSAKNSA